VPLRNYSLTKLFTSEDYVRKTTKLIDSDNVIDCFFVCKKSVLNFVTGLNDNNSEIKLNIFFVNQALCIMLLEFYIQFSIQSSFFHLILLKLLLTTCLVAIIFVDKPWHLICDDYDNCLLRPLHAHACSYLAAQQFLCFSITFIIQREMIE